MKKKKRENIENIWGEKEVFSFQSLYMRQHGTL